MFLFQIDYGANVSNEICLDCQNRVKLAYKIRGELIKAFEKKKKKTIQVYQIISKNESGESKNLDGSVVHEELVEITEIDESEYNTETEAAEQVFVEDEEGLQVQVQVEDDEEDYLNETELITDDLNTDEPLDAVSFLLEKKELFKKPSSASKTKGKRAHKCDACEKSFMRKSNLVDHLRLHANMR